jgi:branched-chain amino acid transport system substrate-binding protein
VAASDILAVKKIFSDLKQRGLTKVAILTASDAYGAGGREDIKELAPQMGIALVADEVFGSKDTDMTAQLTRIKGTPAQAIVVWGTNPGPAIIARNRMQLKVTTPLYMSSGVASKKFIELAGPENAEGIMLPAGGCSSSQLAASHPARLWRLHQIEDDSSSRSRRSAVTPGRGNSRQRLDAVRRAGGIGRRRKHSELPRHRGEFTFGGRSCRLSGPLPWSD